MGPLAMYSRTDIHSVLHLIDRRSRIGGPLLIAVDGLGGAGKSTLAAQLSAALPGSSIVEVDDFYRPMTAEDRADLGPREGYERYFDWMRLLDEAIEPLRKQLRARFRRYDWEMNSLGEWCEVAPSDLVIVEGVYSTRPELRPLFGVTVYVDTPRVQRAARMTQGIRQPGLAGSLDGGRGLVRPSPPTGGARRPGYRRVGREGPA